MGHTLLSLAVILVSINNISMIANQRRLEEEKEKIKKELPLLNSCLCQRVVNRIILLSFHHIF